MVKQASGAYTPVTVQSLEDYHKAWINDAYRTFIGEGQLFFLYKRLDAAFNLNGEMHKLTRGEASLPLPKDQK